MDNKSTVLSSSLLQQQGQDSQQSVLTVPLFSGASYQNENSCSISCGTNNQLITVLAGNRGVLTVGANIEHEQQLKQENLNVQSLPHQSPKGSVTQEDQDQVQSIGSSTINSSLVSVAHLMLMNNCSSPSVQPTSSSLSTQSATQLRDISCSDVIDVLKASKGMIDATVSESRPSPQFQDAAGYSLAALNGDAGGRMSPYSGNIYATLTPLQPLPPISTVSDKFNAMSSSNGSNNYVFLQNNNNGGGGGGNRLYTSYKYGDQRVTEKDPDDDDDDDELDSTSNRNGYEQMDSSSSPTGLMNGSNHGNYNQQQHNLNSIFQSYAAQNGGTDGGIRIMTSPVKSEHNNGNGVTGIAADSLSPYDAVYASNLILSQQQQLQQVTQQQHQQLLSQQEQLSQTVASSMMAQQLLNLNNLHMLHGGGHLGGGHLGVNIGHHGGSPSASSSASSQGQNCHSIIEQQHQQHQQQQQQCCLVSSSPTHDQPTSSTDMHDTMSSRSNGGGGVGSGSGGEMEEINTREIAVRVSNELKKYSIPQAVFAQRVLGRSQGTLSDLLRNPKPWSKLKSGRETFRRMWKWLQEPEFQRMSSLRISGGLQSYTISDVTLSPAKQPLAAAAVVNAVKRSRDAMSSSSNRVISLQGVSSGSGSAADTTSYSSGTSAAALAAAAVAASSSKKPRMVFTEIQRRTLVAIFKEIKRPSKEIQATIAEQLGLKVSTVVNFFMNARRRSVDKYTDESSLSSTSGCGSGGGGMGGGGGRVGSGAGEVVNNTVSSSAGSLDDSLMRQ